MINDIQKVLISFAAGLGIGILGGKVYYEKKYRMKLKGETFNSDKELVSEEVNPEDKVEEKREENKDPKESSEINKNKEDLNSMVKKVQEENPRVDYSTPTPGEEKRSADPEPVVAEDFILEPDDFGERSDDEYEVVSILYLADGNLAYENGRAFDPVEQPEKKIGNEALQVLKNTPNDVIYVRNNRTKIDYEIIKDDRTLNEGISVDDEEDEN